MNLKKEIEIELRFRKAVDLSLVTKRINQYRQKSQYHNDFKFSFAYSHSINS